MTNPCWLCSTSQIRRDPPKRARRQRIQSNRQKRSRSVPTLISLLLLVQPLKLTVVLAVAASTSIAVVSCLAFPLSVVHFRPFLPTSGTNCASRRNLALRASTTSIPSKNPTNTQVARLTSSSSDARYTRIDIDQLQQLRESVDIVSAIESYGLRQFRRSGEHRATALCPFHDDKNPSLSVDGKRRMYKCFSCGAAGDIFNFVREYSKVSKGETLTFYQAVNIVNEQFTNGSPLPLPRSSDAGFGRFDAEEMRILAAQKERIMMANALAAAFYANYLISLKGGAARTYLASRGLNAATVREFAVGFAPDAYFGKKNVGQEWGEGSLVHHLRDRGFSPREIVDSGLAFYCNRTAEVRKPHSDPNSVNNTTFSDDANTTHGVAGLDYSSLMDRFRGRMVVPIFDIDGKQVLGFGGRILSQRVPSGKFKAPKYLNSPESPVFKKKSVLFGHHIAKASIDRTSVDGGNGAFEGKDEAVVLVEGYMDVLALWQVGLRMSVACMGTGLTEEQLMAATRIPSSGFGRVVLCLDSDDAGIASVERVCSNGMLASVSQRSVTEFRVAELPQGIKDPAEFLEQQNSTKTAANEFRRLVLDSSVEWTEWYMDRIMSRYDATALRGGSGSFGDIFEQVANFLASFRNAADRTERTCKGATLLADAMAQAGALNMSETARIQLESDLITMVASIVKSNEAVESRLAAVGEKTKLNGHSSLANLARGDGISGGGDMAKLSAKAIDTIKKKQPTNQYSQSSSTIEKGSGIGVPRRRRSYRARQSSQLESPLVPHFPGFNFKNENDISWVLYKEKNAKRREFNLHLGSVTEDGSINELGQKKPVYFNSNEFNGKQFLTAEAAVAGYTKSITVPDRSLLAKGVGALIRQDPNMLATSAEYALLRTLVLFRSARESLRQSIDLTDAVIARRVDINWSKPENAWLFSSLVENEAEIPRFVTGPEHILDLRVYLACLPDTPLSAFSGHGHGTSKDSRLNDHSHVAIDGELEDRVTREPSYSVAVAEPGPLEQGENGDRSSLEMIDQTTNRCKVSGQPSSTDSNRNSGDGPIQLSEVKSVLEVKLRADSSSDLTSIEAEQAEKIVDAEVVYSRMDPYLERKRAETPGELDHLFTADHDILMTDYDDSMKPDERAELAAQSLYASLLWTSALRQQSDLQEELVEVTGLLRHKERTNGGEGSRRVNVTHDGISLSREELWKHWTNLTEHVRDHSQLVHELAASAKGISRRNMDRAALSSSGEGRLSQGEYDKLRKGLDKHMSEIGKWSIDSPENEECDEEFYEDMLERVKHEWGELSEDERMWKQEDIIESHYPTKVSKDKSSIEGMDYLFEDDVVNATPENESIEEFHSRLERDWGDWVKDD